MTSLGHQSLPPTNLGRVDDETASPGGRPLHTYFKVGLSTAASSRPICQAFGDSAFNERTARHWFQKFRTGDLYLCAKARTGRPQALEDEALQASIEEDSSQTCGELARQFNTSSETVRLHLHRLGKTYRLSKWVLYTLLEVHKRQRVATFSIVAFSPP
ncbi:histone-lysine N-methyltransferase SETMAR [Trichonephila clavipes]|nr:histone-lysine N-methyltransferase SETMAR [Trichonephila clavipes]